SRIFRQNQLRTAHGFSLHQTRSPGPSRFGLHLWLQVTRGMDLASQYPGCCALNISKGKRTSAAPHRDCAILRWFCSLPLYFSSFLGSREQQQLTRTSDELPMLRTPST